MLKEVIVGYICFQLFHINMDNPGVETGFCSIATGKWLNNLIHLIYTAIVFVTKNLRSNSESLYLPEGTFWNFNIRSSTRC